MKLSSIKYLDIFGVNEFLIYKDNTIYKSIFGGIVSFSLILSMIILFLVI